MTEEPTRQSGRILCYFADRKFGKVLLDRDASVVWFFDSDLNGFASKTDMRVSFIVKSYHQKGQDRVRAVDFQLAPPLAIKGPEPVTRIRARQPVPPPPSIEARQKLVNVSTKNLVRL